MDGLVGAGRRPRVLTAAAAPVVVLAVAADLLAGAHTAHVAVLGVVALALGAVRVRAAGRHRPTFTLLGCLVVAPPVLDAGRTFTAGAATEGSLHHLDADSATSLAHMALALVVAAGVVAVEPVLRGLLAGARRWVRALVTGAPPIGPRARPTPSPRTGPGERARPWTRFGPRRGPPVPA